MRAVLFDCFSGASGDMLLGALCDAGVSVDAVRDALRTLPVGGWNLEAEPAGQHGLHGTRAHVRLEQTDQPHRGLSEVLRIIRAGDLPAGVAEQACAVFQRLGEVEAFIHRTRLEAVHFHEVGAVDAIVDVVGVVLGLHLLGAEEIFCTGLPLGSGWVRAAHGRLPVPTPATLELMRRAGAPTRPPPSDGETGELVTPTGAALLTSLARFQSQSASVRIERVGYGFGTREPGWPNAVRLMVGETASGGSDLLRDEVVQIETHLDDATPEELGFAMQHLLAAGALDVAFSPLQMKKNRPGVLLRVLGGPADGDRLAALVLEHTSALGARVVRVPRIVARRSERRVETPWGVVRVKIKHLGSREVAAPEYEDCAAVARTAGVSLREVYEAARAGSGERGTGSGGRGAWDGERGTGDEG